MECGDRNGAATALQLSHRENYMDYGRLYGVELQKQTGANGRRENRRPASAVFHQGRVELPQSDGSHPMHS